jgi:iron-sulfur cluster assembly accessory protein
MLQAVVRIIAYRSDGALFFADERRKGCALMADLAPAARVTMTGRAAERLLEIASDDATHPILRITVEGGGCSGFQYKFDVDREKAEDDLVLERGNATVLIDPVSVGFLAGSEIDFVDDLIGSAFKIINPNAKASCGCGTSFSL